MLFSGVTRVDGISGELLHIEQDRGCGRAAASTILLYVEELPRYAIDAGDPREEHRRHSY